MKGARAWASYSRHLGRVFHTYVQGFVEPNTGIQRGGPGGRSVLVTEGSLCDLCSLRRECLLRETTARWTRRGRQAKEEPLGEHGEPAELVGGGPMLPRSVEIELASLSPCDSLRIVRRVCAELSIPRGATRNRGGWGPARYIRRLGRTPLGRSLSLSPFEASPSLQSTGGGCHATTPHGMSHRRALVHEGLARLLREG